VHFWVLKSGLGCEKKAYQREQLDGRIFHPAIAESDAKTGFRAVASKASIKKGLEVLDHLDKAFQG